MQDTLKFIIQSIVDKPEAVEIEELEEEGVTQFTITADSSDYGKIIGKEGKIIRSIRNIMKIPAIKAGKRINISLADNTPQVA
jgi:predicted RNA-binding protein YlqC (UPF0109 family)